MNLNPVLIAEVLSSLARIAANPAIGAVNNDVVNYAGLLASGIRAGTMVDADLQALQAQMDANESAGRGLSGEELDAIAERIRANSEAIQGG